MAAAVTVGRHKRSNKDYVEDGGDENYVCAAVEIDEVNNEENEVISGNNAAIR